MTVDPQVWMNHIISKLAAVAQLLLEIGQYDAAIDCFQTLSEGDQTYENGDYAYGIGRAYEGKGDFVTALEWFELAQVNNPPVAQFNDAISRVKQQMELP